VEVLKMIDSMVKLLGKEQTDDDDSEQERRTNGRRRKKAKAVCECVARQDKDSDTHSPGVARYHGDDPDFEEEDDGEDWDEAFLEDSHDHQHDNRVSSVGISVAGEVDQNKLNDWIGWLLKERGADIFRCKGILAVRGMNDKFVFQAVHMVFSGAPQKPWSLRDHCPESASASKVSKSQSAH